MASGSSGARQVKGSPATIDAGSDWPPARPPASAAKPDAASPLDSPAGPPDVPAPPGPDANQPQTPTADADRPPAGDGPSAPGDRGGRALGKTVCLNADGPGGIDTVALMESILGDNCVEDPGTPDSPPFKHVQEDMDAEVGPHFVVFSHPNDSDMGRNNGRNRCEFKIHTASGQ